MMTFNCISCGHSRTQLRCLPKFMHPLCLTSFARTRKLIKQSVLLQLYTAPQL